MRPALLALAGLTGYATYSLAVYRRLRIPFLRMRLVAAARPEAGKEEITQAAADLLRARGQDANENLPGVELGSADAAALLSQLSKLLPSPEEVDVDDLFEASQGDEASVVEGVEERLRWHALLMQAHEGAAKVEAQDLEGTSWRFCFRDYINEEELLVMAGRRGAFTLVRRLGAGRLTLGTTPRLGADVSATLREELALLGVVPVQIEWRGRLVSVPEAGSAQSARDAQSGPLELRWEDTSLRLGWPRFGRTVERPPAAERLRQQPWEVRGFLGRPTTGEAGTANTATLALCRRGIGTLAYTKV